MSEKVCYIFITSVHFHNPKYEIVTNQNRQIDEKIPEREREREREREKKERENKRRVREKHKDSLQ